jgi:hypothetical protein
MELVTTRFGSRRHSGKHCGICSPDPEEARYQRFDGWQAIRREFLNQ